MPNPLKTLTLKRELALDGPLRRAGYRVVEIAGRLLPFVTIYGGTAALACCIYHKYNWAAIMSLTLYNLLNAKTVFGEMALVGAYGLFKVWTAQGVDWHASYLRETGAGARKDPERLSDAEEKSELNGKGALRQSDNQLDGSKTELEWNDVFHVVMVPNYKTPLSILTGTIQQLQHFSLAKTNMGICLAFEEREAGAEDKARQLKNQFGSSFRFITATYHPPNLPNHVPGKSSNECWAFSELVKEMEHKHGFSSSDPRVIITVIDDDSEMHSNYFEALSYKFLRMDETRRYLTLWQSPVTHFKNYVTQPNIVRAMSWCASLHELACLANRMDCHVPFSSYSLSLILASAVGGWDPDFISEDWHMMAKCSIKTQGRTKCEPIFLPLLNYAPEEDTWCGTLGARWTQALRHALGVSEIVYVFSKTYVGMCEHESLGSALVFLWRMMPLVGKFILVHFTTATLPVWRILTHVVISRKAQALLEVCETADSRLMTEACAHFDNGNEKQMLVHSWMVFICRQASMLTYVGILLSTCNGAMYFLLLKDRLGKDLPLTFRNPFLHIIRMLIESALTAPIALTFACVPEWVASVRIITTTRFYHSVAGMVGRSDDGASV